MKILIILLLVLNKSPKDNSISRLFNIL